MRKFLADTFAMITFSWVIGMLIEVGISGMTFGQSLQSRITGTFVNLLTGGLYGKFRDWLLRKTQAATGSWLKRMGVDITAFILFQVPLYVLILMTTGASLRQIITAVGTVTVFSTFVGGPYGLFLTFVRRVFRVSENT